MYYTKYLKYKKKYLKLKNEQFGSGMKPSTEQTADNDSVAFAQEIKDRGGEATALFADGTKVEETVALVKKIEGEIGPIAFINYNIGAQVGNRTLEKTSYRIFELAWRMGSLGAFAIAKEGIKCPPVPPPVIIIFLIFFIFHFIGYT